VFYVLLALRIVEKGGKAKADSKSKRERKLNLFLFQPSIHILILPFFVTEESRRYGCWDVWGVVKGLAEAGDVLNGYSIQLRRLLPSDDTLPCW
jgi:hypothetical protein